MIDLNLTNINKIIKIKTQVLVCRSIGSLSRLVIQYRSLIVNAIGVSFSNNLSPITYSCLARS